MTDSVDTATNNGKVVSTEETHVDGNVLTTVTKSKTVRRRKKTMDRFPFSFNSIG